ncbi:MAG: hypothetical protein FWG89_10810 [Treponema sp.]|nr:hypothetical protein [Treponema sp.]
MKKLLFVFGLVFILTLGPVSCDIGDMDFAGSESGQFISNRVDYSEAWEEINFHDHAIPYRFGPSVGGRIWRQGENVTGMPHNLQAAGNATQGNGPFHTSNGGFTVPDGHVALITSSGGGKIAGSEDGILYYFKEVDMSKNFKIEAEFDIIYFGISTHGVWGDRYSIEDTSMSCNGQAGWGIMIRDEVPETGSGSSARTQASVRALYQPNFMDSNTSTDPSGRYNLATRGGDANMFMVGATKWGLRRYWRQGVRWNGLDLRSQIPQYDEDGNITGYEEYVGVERGTGNRIATSGAGEYMNHGTTRFAFLPDADGDYNLWTNAAGTTPSWPARWDFPERGSRYRVTLEKTNNGYDYRLERLDGPASNLPPEQNGDPNSKNKRNGVVMSSYSTDTMPYYHSPNPQRRLPLYDIADSINKEKYYVGFFAARNAGVSVSNIKYWEANKTDTEPYVRPLPEIVMPSIEVVTPPYYGGQDHIWIKSNIDGNLIVSQDGVRIPDQVIFKEWVREPTNDMAIPHTMWMVPIMTPKTGANTFTLQFNPNPVIPPDLERRYWTGAVIGSTAPMRRTWVMERKEYHGGTGDIFISPDGRATNAGTRGSPLSLLAAINYVQPGQRIVMLDGEYVMSDYVTIPRFNEGRHGQEKVLMAENLYMAAIDFKRDLRLRGPGGQFTNHGILLNGSYWILDGFHVRNASDNSVGVKVGGHNNTVRWLLVYNAGDSGIQMSCPNTEPVRNWPSYNTIEFCTSFNNRDTSETNADGFAAKLNAGDGNKFLWNISHNNTDDGWDLFAKKETGPTGITHFFGCVAYSNRFLLSDGDGGNGRNSSQGAGNNFKLGGEGLAVPHEVRHSIGIGGRWSANSNPIPESYFSNGGAVTAFTYRSQDTSGTLANITYTWAEAFPGVPFPPLVMEGSFQWTWRESQSVFMKRIGLFTGNPADVDADGRPIDGRPDFRSKAANRDWEYRPTGPEWQPGVVYPNTFTGSSPTGPWAFFVDPRPEPDWLPR